MDLRMRWQALPLILLPCATRDMIGVESPTIIRLHSGSSSSHLIFVLLSASLELHFYISTIAGSAIVIRILPILELARSSVLPLKFTHPHQNLYFLKVIWLFLILPIFYYIFIYIPCLCCPYDGIFLTVLSAFLSDYYTFDVLFTRTGPPVRTVLLSGFYDESYSVRFFAGFRAVFPLFAPKNPF